MASSRLVVNLDQPEADLIIMAWLNDEDMEQDDESEHPQEVPRNNIPEELLSDPEDECIPSDHDSESECSIDSDCEDMVASIITGKDLRPLCCDSQRLTAARFLFLYETICFFISFLRFHSIFQIIHK
ncbi:hypothetical protein ACJJTC_013041 [Scirpophaga incertulas]